MSAEIARLAKQKAAEYIRAARAAAARQDRSAAGAALLEASKWAQLAEANGAPRPSVPWSLLDGLPTPWPSERGGGRTVPMFANPLAPILPRYVGDVDPGHARALEMLAELKNPRSNPPDLAAAYFKASKVSARRRDVFAGAEADTLRQVGLWIHAGRDPWSIVLWASNGTFGRAAILPLGYPDSLPEWVAASARLQTDDAIAIDALNFRLVLAVDALNFPPRLRRVGAAIPKRANPPAGSPLDRAAETLPARYESHWTTRAGEILEIEVAIDRAAREIRITGPRTAIAFLQFPSSSKFVWNRDARAWVRPLNAKAIAWLKNNGIIDDSAPRAGARIAPPAAPPPAPPPAPKAAPKPSILRGKAREVLARAGKSATLAELAGLACVDEAAAKRIARTLERAGAATKTGPDRWKLDPSALEQCPPPRVATVRAVAPCAGECGVWRTAPKGSPSWVAALGPTSPVYDSEGRRYRVQYALARLADLGKTWHASNVNGRSDPAYLPEFQARLRGSAVSDAQVAAIADALDVARWIAPSATPTDGTPIVWSPRIIPPPAQVLAGNGRIAAWVAARPDALRVASELEQRWKIPPALRPMLAAGGLVPVRILTDTRERAVTLAAASQSAAAGALTASERATTAVRSLGLTVETMPAIDWARPLSPSTVAEFARRNAPWLEWSLAPLDRARRMTVQGDPALLAEHAIGVLVGLLPDSARVPPIGGVPLDRALMGALPGIWSSRALTRTLEAGAEWDLTTAIGPARSWARRLKPERLAALGSELAQAERQGGLFDDSIAPGADADPRSAALGAVLARAAGRASPEDAAAEYLERFIAAIPDPRQVSMMMLDTSAPDAAEVLASIARVKIKRTNPRRVKALASWAAAWHWGRYSAAQVAQVERAPSDPASGFALGELAAITVDGRRYLAPPGHLLCSSKPGASARLFVAPPLALPPAATGPIACVEYLADKGSDGLSHYVHDFKSPLPEVTATSPMRISRANSQFFIDLDRGIVR